MKVETSKAIKTHTCAVVEASLSSSSTLVGDLGTKRQGLPFPQVAKFDSDKSEVEGVGNQRWCARSVSKTDCVTCHHSIEWREKKVCKGHFERRPSVGRKWKWFVKTQSWGRFYFEMAPAASSAQAQPSGGKPVDLPMEKRKPSKFGNLVSLLTF